MFWLAFLAPVFAVEPVSVVEGVAQELHVRSGDHKMGVVTLRNNTDVVQTVRLRQRDYTFAGDRHTEHVAPGQLRASNAEWLQLERRQVLLKPGSTVEVAWMLDVPEDVVHGTYGSVVVVESLGEDVASVVRSAVQMLSNVGLSGSRVATTK